MRRIFFLSLVFILYAMATRAQEGAKKADAADDTLLPYQKNMGLPAFNIRLLDDNTVFNTYNIPAGSPVIIMMFLPECSHCRKTTEGLLKGMDSLKQVQFYMVTPFHDMKATKKFYDDLHLADYKNIKIVGRDYEFFYHDFYGVKSVPDLVLYDEHKKLVKLFEGETTVGELYKYVH